MIPEERLGPDQREVIDNLSANWKNSWIKGHAGSGKSVLLIHLVREYLVRNPRASVCVVVFTRSLVDMLEVGINELDLEERFEKEIPVMTIYQFQNSDRTYDAVFCDEVQDLPISFLELLKERSGKVIVAGDEAQSIYNKVPGFNEPPAESNAIVETLNAKPMPLEYIYRMTRSVVRMLCRVFNSLLSGRPNPEKNDVEIKLCRSSNTESEIRYVWNTATQWNTNRPDEIIAILLPNINQIIAFTNSVLSQENHSVWEPVMNRFDRYHFGSMNNHLRNQGIEMMYVGQGYGSLTEAEEHNKIVLMTYSSAKGLDFDHVILPLLGDNIRIPLSKVEALLFVALSRSKYNLMVSYTGSLYYAMQEFMDGERVYDIENENTERRIII